MTAYFLRRLMLVPLTFVAITLLVYAIQRLTPGGPIEQAELQLRMAAAGEGGGGGSLSDTGELKIPQAGLDQLKKYYKLDKPIVVGYLIWLGAWPDDAKGDRFSGILQGDFGRSYRYSEPVLDTIVSRFPVSIYFGLIGYLMTWIVCVPLGVQKALKHRSFFDTSTSIVVFLGYAIPGFVACLLLLLLLATPLGQGIFESSWWAPLRTAIGVAAGVLLVATQVVKRRAGTPPAWVTGATRLYPILLGAFLLMLGSVLYPLPLGGFRSDNWDERWAQGDWWWCVRDQVEHTIIPLVGYMLGSFATMTIMMKNSLLENLSADYVRTAFAKGLPERRVVFVHALRNSMIPLLVGIGHAIGLLFAGSFLIEKTCNINGMGLLGFTSLVERDYPVLMGILVFLVLIGLIGNIISDIILAFVDPRVRFR